MSDQFQEFAGFIDGNQGVIQYNKSMTVVSRSTNTKGMRPDCQEEEQSRESAGTAHANIKYWLWVS
jgi:hypothetical protein